MLRQRLAEPHADEGGDERLRYEEKEVRGIVGQVERLHPQEEMRPEERSRDREPAKVLPDLAKVASATGFVDTEGDQNERDCHEYPARMKAACSPKVSESAKKIKAPNE